MVIIGGIYFELQTPGIGFPLILCNNHCFIIFAPLYIQGFASNWEIIVFIIGVILLGIEVFLIPGFGVVGIIGIVMIISSLAFD